MSLPQNSDPDKTSPPSTSVTTLTGVGRSAVAVIGLRGCQAETMLRQCFQSASPGRLWPGQIRYGQWRLAQEQDISGESVVVTPIGHDEFEIHCHGGPAAIERIVKDLQTCGATWVAADAWCSATDPSLLIGEARQVLWQCVTARTAAIAMDQVRGAMQRWTEDLLKQTRSGSVSVSAVQQAAAKLARLARFGTRLASPFRVVLVGPPNVGKSSLLNCLVGYDRSITLDVAGTTRDVLHAETVIDGLPIRLSDTAGIRDSEEPIEKEGIARARLAADQADLLLWISEPGRCGEPPPAATAAVRVLNKCDLIDAPVVPPASQVGTIETNALTGQGVDELIAAIANSLAAWIPPSGSPVPVSERQAGLIGKLSQADNRDQIEGLLRELLGLVPPGDES